MLARTLLSLALGALFLTSGVARADSGCVLGCNMTNRECIRSARLVKLGCKAECREAAAPEERGSCSRACTKTFRTTMREVCRPGHHACIDGCMSPDHEPPDRCQMVCGKDRASCARGVVTEGRLCVQGCRTDADRLGCLARCADHAEEGAAMCEDEFSGCLTDCGGGSASGAFLE